MSLRHSVKHLECNSAQQIWRMHEHSENMPQYMLELPHGANTNAKIPNGTKPNQEIEKNFTKIRIPTHFRKIPNFENPN